MVVWVRTQHVNRRDETTGGDMRRTYKVDAGTDFEHRITYESPYSIISTELSTPEELGKNDGVFEARLWGLAQYVPATAYRVMAMFGAFHREGRHVVYDALAIYEDGELIHNPMDEMIDDITYLLAGQGEIA